MAGPGGKPGGGGNPIMKGLAGNPGGGGNPIMAGTGRTPGGGALGGVGWADTVQAAATRPEAIPRIQ